MKHELPFALTPAIGETPPNLNVRAYKPAKFGGQEGWSLSEAEFKQVKEKILWEDRIILTQHSYPGDERRKGNKITKKNIYFVDGNLSEAIETAIQGLTRKSEIPVKVTQS